MLRRIGLAALALLAAVGLAGCGGGPPATLDALPTFPGATRLEAGQNAMADSMAAILTQSAAAELRSDVRVYTVPTDTDWAAVKAFYGAELGKGDWRADERLANDSAALSTTGWSRGGLVGEQVLLLSFAPDSVGAGAFLIVGLFSE